MIIENIDWSKSHCGVILCDFEKVKQLMPEVVPVIEDLRSSAPLQYDISKYLIDVKVHMLMPNQFPCIPDWHQDFVPRDSDGKLCHEKITTNEKMYLWVSGEPRTEFVEKPKTITTFQGQRWVEFNQNSMHRGVKANKRTWRCFVRLTPKTLIKNRPTQNKDTSHRGSLRRHCQVYLDSKNYSW